MTIDALSQSALVAPPRRYSAIPANGVIEMDKVIGLEATTRTPQASALRLQALLDPDAIMAALREAGLVPEDGQADLFAEVYKNGQVVARLDNGGGAETLGVAAGTVTGVDEPYDGGPELAQWRADNIARAVGGTVKRAATAQTQAQWRATSAEAQLKHDQVLSRLRAALEATQGPASPEDRPPVSVTA